MYQPIWGYSHRQTKPLFYILITLRYLYILPDNNRRCIIIRNIIRALLQRRRCRATTPQFQRRRLNGGYQTRLVRTVDAVAVRPVLRTGEFVPAVELVLVAELPLVAACHAAIAFIFRVDEVGG